MATCNHIEIDGVRMIRSDTIYGYEYHGGGGVRIGDVVEVEKVRLADAAERIRATAPPRVCSLTGKLHHIIPQYRLALYESMAHGRAWVANGVPAENLRECEQRMAKIAASDPIYGAVAITLRDGLPA